LKSLGLRFFICQVFTKSPNPKKPQNHTKENQDPPCLFAAFVFLGYPRKIGHIAKAHF
jgi:hypothetical protein